MRNKDKKTTAEAVKTTEKKKNALYRFLDRPVFSWAVVSLVVYLITEGINQRGVLQLFGFIFTRPYAFIFNLAIIMLTYSVVLFVRRRLFGYSLITIIWLIMGGINLVLILQRNTQFNFSDILIFRYGIFITTRYLSILHCILIAVGLTVLTVAVILLYRRGYKCPKPDKKRKMGIIVGSLAALIFVMGLIGNLSGILMPRFTEIKKGFSKNGFVYAFFCSAAESGVDEPEKFSKGSVEEIISHLPEGDAETDQRPNVIFVQMESFIDPDEFVGVEFTGDPVPNYNRLIAEYPSGHLNVSVLGGGTANTEFEILTGMNIKHFGTIEYPYESFLDENTCESMAYNYKALGYSAHAMHNFSAGFYMRNKVFANMGFDTFTSFEYMTDMVYNKMGWAKDMILERYIMAALESSDNPDFVYAISVQGHGSYPTDFDDSESDIDTTYLNEDLDDHSEQIDYYISQIREMDAFIGSLTDTLSEYDEPTVVVFYGDHLPGIALSAEMLETGTLYKTEYVVWSNFDIEGEDRDICTYQLASYVQSLIGLSSGQMTKFHQTYMDDPDYEEKHRILEYDITEGNMLTYGGTNPFVATDIKYGVTDIYITDIMTMSKNLYVMGEGFNEHSAVYINGNKKSTEYVNSTTLMVEGGKVKDGDRISVAQMNYQMPWDDLSKCEEFVYTEE